MPDNTIINPQTGGDTIATDDIGGVKHQRVKVEFGADGSATDVSPGNPLPATDARVFGYLSGTAPATVDVPAGARVKRIAVVAAVGAAATITIAGGSVITVPPGLGFDEQIPGEVALGADVIIGGSIQSFYVGWVT